MRKRVTQGHLFCPGDDIVINFHSILLTAEGQERHGGVSQSTK